MASIAYSTVYERTVSGEERGERERVEVPWNSRPSGEKVFT